MDLEGKTALITGGGTGIGRGIALALAREGCRVAVSGRREEPLAQTASLAVGPHPVLCRAADVADRDAVRALVSWATGSLGRIDILVNSAGSNVKNRLMADLDPEGWDRILQINATGAFNCIHAVLPAMRERRDGLIVNISSTAGKRASLLGGTAYAASKFAMSALGTAVGAECREEGVRVSNIYPGEVNTPILDRRPRPVSDEHRARILQSEDVAAAVLMICKLPPRANVCEMVIKPTTQEFI